MLLLGVNLTAQVPAKGQQAIFAEIGGMAPDFSVNYRNTFSQIGNFPLALRAGISITRSVFALPLGLEATSPDAPHHLQVAAGITPFVINNSRVKSNTREDSDAFMDLVVGIGYRYEQKGSRWFAAGMVYPKLRLDPAESNYLELSPEIRLALGIIAGFNL